MRLTHLAIVLLCSILVACRVGPAWEGDTKRIHDIKAGMSRQQVVSVLGEPTHKLDLMGVEVWEYEGDDDRANVGFSESKVYVTALNGKELIVAP